MTDQMTGREWVATFAASIGVDAPDEATIEALFQPMRDAFDEIVFRPRMAVRVADPDLSTTVLGERVALPVLLAPCGGLRAVHPHGESGAARAAHRAGTVFCLSSAAGTSMSSATASSTGVPSSPHTAVAIALSRCAACGKSTIRTASGQCRSITR